MTAERGGGSAITSSLIYIMAKSNDFIGKWDYKVDGMEPLDAEET